MDTWSEIKGMLNYNIRYGLTYYMTPSMRMTYRLSIFITIIL